MICEEVIELMQRDLDRDLGHDEHERLQQHIQECDECRRMYERLQLVSNELANLPKVTPAFSLVDAILPQLEQIEQMNMNFQAAGGASITTGTSSDTETNRSRASTVSWKNKLRSGFTLKVAGGVAAAAIALVLLFNYEPPSTLNNAEQMHPESGSMTNSANSASKFMATDDAGGAESEDATSNDVSNDVFTDQGNAPNNSESNSAGSGFSKDMGDGNASDKNASDDNTAATDDVAQRLDLKRTASAEDKMSSNPKVQKESASQAEEPGKENLEEEPLSFMAVPELDKSKSDSAMQDETNNEEMFGIAGVFDEFPPPVASPDQTMFAVVEIVDGFMQVVIVDQQFMPITSSNLYNAKEIASIRWTDDSTTIQYDVIAEDTVLKESLVVTREKAE